MIAEMTNGEKHASVNRLNETAAPNKQPGCPEAAGVHSPSPDGANGRDAGGRFTRGNPGGPGNPFARRIAELRRAAIATVTEDDIQAVITALIAKAKQGDVAAARRTASDSRRRRSIPIRSISRSGRSFARPQSSPAR